jgi:GNAT superfamily N-acetyltransferase
MSEGLEALSLGPGLEPLRRAHPSDVAAITAMQQAAYRPNRAIIGSEPLPLRVDYADIVAEKETWIAGPGETIDGLLILELRPAELHVWNVSVAPNVQGKGLGNLLLAAAESRARALGLKRLTLLTNERLTRNIAWYGRHGYVLARVEAFADRRIVHMAKAL